MRLERREFLSLAGTLLLAFSAALGLTGRSIGADSMQARALALSRESRAEIVRDMTPLTSLGLTPQDAEAIADAIAKGGQGGQVIAAFIVTAIASASADSAAARRAIDHARSLATTSTNSSGAQQQRIPPH